MTRTGVSLLILICAAVHATAFKDVHVITVATEFNDALQRLLRSAEHNDFNVTVIGLGEPWKGGDVSKTAGGGHKVKLLRSELMKYINNEDSLILFVDGYDVIFMDTKERLLQEYKNIGAVVLFSAEDFCWPQSDLEKHYPPVASNEKRFLNSGAFMGPAADLYRIVSANYIEDSDDDQLYYTNIFLTKKLREELNIQLDTSARIFQNLHGSMTEVELRFTEDTGYLYNTRMNTTPIIVHGNGPIKPEFNSLVNYLDYNWTPTRGCQHCEENTIDMTDPEKFPVVQLSIFIDQPTPFLDVFFERIGALTYPKNRIHLTGYIAHKADKQRGSVEAFNTTYGPDYRTATWFEAEDEGHARDKAFAYCLATEDCQFMLAIDSTVQLTATNTLEHLVHMNRSMLAPLVTRRGKLWSNFWGALSKQGYYDRSEDYVDIVEGTIKGVWNVPFVRDVYVLSRAAVRKLLENKFAGSTEFDMEIAQKAREKNVFMTVDNQMYYGYMTYADTYSVDHIHNDLWQIFDNPLDWEEQYVNPEYFQLIGENVTMQDIQQPCPDVFYFPIATTKFCKQLIEETETFGQWSDGGNYDSRLEGGYENVPTRDIHMRQIGWEEHWLHFLVKYIHPIQKKVFQGYEDKPWARMNFVVRYRPDEQPSLRPHHDASSYTLNLVLNQPGVDFQGGGTKFNRYNCSVTKPEVGWMTMFPGRVTHLHEGLTTKTGTRYIFVTFVNP